MMAGPLCTARASDHDRQFRREIADLGGGQRTDIRAERTAVRGSTEPADSRFRSDHTSMAISS